MAKPKTQGAGDGAETQEKAAAAGVRIVCALPNASANINGVAFGPLPATDPKAAPRVMSESLPPDHPCIDVWLSVPGFSPAGAEDLAQAEAVDAAIQAAREAAASAGAAVSHAGTEASRTIAELQDSNRRLSEEVTQLRGQVAQSKDAQRLAEVERQLAETTTQLTEARRENERLRAVNEQLGATP